MVPMNSFCSSPPHAQHPPPLPQLFSGNLGSPFKQHSILLRRRHQRLSHRLQQQGKLSSIETGSRFSPLACSRQRVLRPWFGFLASLTHPVSGVFADSHKRKQRPCGMFRSCSKNTSPVMVIAPCWVDFFMVCQEKHFYWEEIIY